MGRFNVSKYDPANDSSKGFKPETPEGLPAVAINCNGQHELGVADGVLCYCGCGDEPQGKNSKFRMGHDARLRGILIRAHLAGLPIVRYWSTGPETLDAIKVAAEFDNERFSWTDALRHAESTQGASVKAKLEAANKNLLRRATGPQVGDRKLVKVGRWEYTGQVIAIFEDRGQQVIEYVTKSGETKTTTVPVEDAK